MARTRSPIDRISSFCFARIYARLMTRPPMLWPTKTSGTCNIISPIFRRIANQKLAPLSNRIVPTLERWYNGTILDRTKKRHCKVIYVQGALLVPIRIISKIVYPYILKPIVEREPGFRPIERCITRLCPSASRASS